MPAQGSVRPVIPGCAARAPCAWRAARFAWHRPWGTSVAPRPAPGSPCAGTAGLRTRHPLPARWHLRMRDRGGAEVLGHVARPRARPRRPPWLGHAPMLQPRPHPPRARCDMGRVALPSCKAFLRMPAAARQLHPEHGAPSGARARRRSDGWPRMLRQAAGRISDQQPRSGSDAREAAPLTVRCCLGSVSGLRPRSTLA